MPWSPDPAQRLPPWETPKPSSPQTAAPSSSAAAAPQPGPTPEEDRISLAALAAGATPAKAPKVQPVAKSSFLTRGFLREAFCCPFAALQVVPQTLATRNLLCA